MAILNNWSVRGFTVYVQFEYTKSLITGFAKAPYFQFTDCRSISNTL